MLEILKSVAFGIIEGITEWLPVSSTGHMILLEEVMPFSTKAVSSEFMEMFLVVIQLGAIMAVVLMYWNQLFPFSFKKKSRADIVKLVVSGDLVPAQLVQIKSAIEKGLTESQLVELINNNISAEKMKEIIEIAVLENSMAD